MTCTYLLVVYLCTGYESGKIHLKNIKKKSLKDYSGVSLLLAVDTFDYFEVYDNSSKPFVKELLKEIKSFYFKADKIYLLVINNQNVSQIDQNIYLVNDII